MSVPYSLWLIERIRKFMNNFNWVYIVSFHDIIMTIRNTILRVLLFIEIEATSTVVQLINYKCFASFIIKWVTTSQELLLKQKFINLCVYIRSVCIYTTWDATSSHITIRKSKSCLRSNRVINFDRHGKVNKRTHMFADVLQLHE